MFYLSFLQQPSHQSPMSVLFSLQVLAIPRNSVAIDRQLFHYGLLNTRNCSNYFAYLLDGLQCAFCFKEDSISSREIYEYHICWITQFIYDMVFWACSFVLSQVSLCSPGWPRPGWGFEFTEIPPPMPPESLELRTYTSTFSFWFFSTTFFFYS